ncbi:hypothetical protein AK830_g3617 [Neonectria ditissima]|uniref:Zn(2)-C6 fungal-type domain-containing protein n=1 Tax=Neonectria ditissima TaxID=78410 RepID=A0A0P7B8B8_9HYPO|nr:hypothetical protein AK830_g3617 [Neonectria ditissima]
MANFYTRRTLIIPASTPAPSEPSSRHNLAAPLRLSAHDYHVRDSDESAFTVILTHGTSFNKHFWELIINSLLTDSGLRSRVKRLIAIDAANHGDSAVLNRDVLPTKAFWPDDSRDILHTLKYFGVQQPVIGIGHSFGGGAMCHAAMMNPGAFWATIFIEPILFQMKDQTEGVARMAAKRRDKWDSKADLITAFQKNKGLQDWDRRQLDVYVEHGTIPIGEDSVSSPRTLKTPKEQEAATYLAAPYPEILALLSQSRGEHHFVWGADSKVISGPDRESVSRIMKPPSTTQVLAGAGHLNAGEGQEVSTGGSHLRRDKIWGLGFVRGRDRSPVTKRVRRSHIHTVARNAKCSLPDLTVSSQPDHPKTTCETTPPVRRGSAVCISLRPLVLTSASSKHSLFTHAASSIDMASEAGKDPRETITVADLDGDDGGDQADESARRDKRGSIDEDRQQPQQGTPSSPDPSERPAKKMKRGKYISRACTSCQQRKIKCEGGEPCAPCVQKKRQCVSAPRGGQPKQDQKSWATGSEPDSTNMNPPTNNVSNHELLARLVEVERRLCVMQGPNQDDDKYQPRLHSHSHGGPSGEDLPTPKSTDLQNVLEADGQTFAGEISMSPAFQDVGENLGPVNASSKSAGFSPRASHQNFASGEKRPRKMRGWLETVLKQHGIVPDEEEWRRYLVVFMDEIHVLYPVLHRPTIWETFNELWEYSALWSMTNSAEREQKRMSAALICFCLALGRCSVSTRMTDANGVHSAGWSLYSAGVALMQDTMEMSNTAAKSLLAMQILLLRVLYLFRLDATQRATRILALLVSNAHIVGLHRQSTYEGLPIFWSQLYCRTWWSIYVLDRRLAIESGRPCLIQDSNIDTAWPLALGDDWLSRFSKKTDTAQSLKAEIVAEIASEPITPIPYLTAMVRFSRVVGKVWELLYGMKGSTSSSAMVEYADTVLCNLLENLPRDLAYDPAVSPDVQFSTRLRWQVKQAMLLFSCTTFLRLLIRRPFLSDKTSGTRTEDDELESVSLCAGLAASILTAHESISDPSLKYCFPLSHYLTSSTMVMLGLVTREPQLKKRYKGLILAATRSLNMYSHRIWVSGKMMRWVSKLSLIVHRTLSDGSPEDLRMQNAEEDFDVDSSSHMDGTQQAASGPQDLSQAPNPNNNQFTSDGRALQAPALSGDDMNSLQGMERRESMVSAHTSTLSERQPSKSDETTDIWTMMETDNDNPSPELPGWAMLDFNFEAIINGDGLYPGIAGGELSAISEDGKSTIGRGGQGMGFDVDQSVFGALASNGMFDLDLNVDKAVLNLCNQTNDRY